MVQLVLRTQQRPQQAGALSPLRNARDLAAHTRSARATQPTELLVVPRESFEELLGSNPEVAARFRNRLGERLAVPGGDGESALNIQI